MLKRILLFCLMLTLASLAQAQTLIAAGSKVTDTQAQHIVLLTVAQLSTSGAFGQQNGADLYLASSGMSTAGISIVENASTNYAAGFSGYQDSTAASFTNNAISNLQTSLGLNDYAEFLAFTRTQKQMMNIYATSGGDISTYTTIVGDPGDGSSGTVDGVAKGFAFSTGDVYNIGSAVCKDYPQPPVWTLVDGTTIRGTVSNLSAQAVAALKAYDNGTVQKGGFVSYPFVLNYGPSVCGGISLVKFKIPTWTEIAHTRVKNVSGNAARGPFTYLGTQKYDWTVVPYCSNILPSGFPDWDPLGVYDYPLLPTPVAWDSSAVCARIPNVTGWVCQDIYIVDPAYRYNYDPGPKNDCTYNP